MARSRQGRGNARNTVEAPGSASNEADASGSNNNNDRGDNSNMSANDTELGNALSQDDIQALLSNTRSRGEYAQVLSEFLDSEEAGIKVDLETGILAGKTVAKAFAGFNNARTAVNKDTGVAKIPGALSVKVIKSKDGESLFLVNQTKVTQSS